MAPSARQPDVSLVSNGKEVSTSAGTIWLFGATKGEAPRLGTFAMGSNFASKAPRPNGSSACRMGGSLEREHATLRVVLEIEQTKQTIATRPEVAMAG